MQAFIESLAPLATRRVVLVGGKGGVGKTTVAIAAALHLSRSGRVILFTSDPASSLADFLGGANLPDGLTLEALDAPALYDRFLAANLGSFLEIGDRGTYLDRQELQRLFELSLPGVDELMAWMRIGELAEENPDALLLVDTAPTGHTLRMIGSSGHFRQLAAALDAMQEKHRAMVRQFTRREVRDPLDAFIAQFAAAARLRSELLADPARAAFVPVALSEPLVVEQTIRLAGEVPVDVPFVVLNRAVLDPDCARDVRLAERDEEARRRLAPLPVVDAARSCEPLDDLARIAAWSEGARPAAAASPTLESEFVPGERSLSRGRRRLVFFAGKGGVGKTTCATATALMLARGEPSKRWVVVSVDPAHSLRDVFAAGRPPENLAVETIDTKMKWQRLRETLGDQISGAIDSLMPRGVTLEHDREAMRQLIEIAPPGADELFAITRLADLAQDQSVAGVVVDTAPTGHFLRLLDLPRQAGEWVREFMRLLLRYRELIPAGSLGEELVRASRALRDLDERMRSDEAEVLVVTRPERIVLAETRRLIDELRGRGITVGGVIANYVTPDSGCTCDRSMRGHELRALAGMPGLEPFLVERRSEPPSTLSEIESLLPWQA